MGARLRPAGGAGERFRGPVVGGTAIAELYPGTPRG